MMSRRAQRNPTLYLAALIATSAVAISYKVYDSYLKSSSSQSTQDTFNQTSLTSTTKPFTISKKYLNKTIAITLSSSFLSSQLPLNEILTTQENMIFIIPPNLSEDDLNVKIPPNFKLLKCSNVQGYLQILKNLKPDCLLLCSDDLGINYTNLSSDLRNFIRTIINVEQDQDLLLQVKPVFN
ncbi:PEX22 [Candida theae]|uniref:Peroxisome assembly protein 22 n=1 Tax=Candida theae TaxID=1198502 RepID=A0AAD5BEV2_9ASCO|nr:PEX22 [Candida theae]KAI5958220.1 PEX22 [Candida theae]